MNAGRNLFFICVAAALGFFCYGEYSEYAHSKAMDQQTKQRDAATHNTIVLAGKQYGAIVGWEEDFKDKSSVFTVQIQNAIMPKDGRPIVIEGYMEDIERKNDQYFLHVGSWMTTGFTITFIIGCDEATAKSLMKSKTAIDPINLIARITSVEQAALALKSGNSSSEDTAPVEVDTSSTYIAKGDCIAVIPNN